MREITEVMETWGDKGWRVEYTNPKVPGRHSTYWSKYSCPDALSAYSRTLQWLTELDELDQKEHNNGTCT